jgi:hypothetical protein
MGIQDPGHGPSSDTNRGKGGRRKYGISTVVLAVLLCLSIAAALLLALRPLA